MQDLQHSEKRGGMIKLDPFGKDAVWVVTKQGEIVIYFRKEDYEFEKKFGGYAAYGEYMEKFYKTPAVHAWCNCLIIDKF